MILPQQLLYAVSQSEGGHIVLIIGAGCSQEAPTNLPLSDECALEAYRRLIADGILIEGECPNPSDLSCLADTVIAKKGRQYELVIRLPREKFRKARANLGHLLAAAMLREKALSCVMTLNFDLAMTSALVEVSGEEVSVIARPEEFIHLGNVNLVYLHCNVEADPEAWIISSEALDKGWRNGWQEIVAQRVISSPVIVFVGLGTPVAVILESTHRVKSALPAGTSVFQVDPELSENSPFFQRLGIEKGNYIQMTWVNFMKALADRLTEEHVSLLRTACNALIQAEGWEIDLEAIGQLCQAVSNMGLLGLGKLRAHSILHDSNYYPHINFNVEWLADLLLGVYYIENIGNCKARIHEDGVVEFTRDGQLVGIVAIMSGRGFRRWLTAETHINQYQHHWRHHVSKPRCVVASGITDGRPLNVAPPKQLISDEETSIVSDLEKLEMYTVDELIIKPELIRRFIS
jgi:hypothetical protein